MILVYLKKKIHSYFVCLFISLSSAASDEIDKKSLETKLKDINACLIQQTNPSGDFTQNKYITILDDPIVTTGHFKKEQNTTFIWHQVSPIDVQYILDKNQLYRVNKDGNQQRLTLSGKQLEFTLINTLIKATLGKFDAISNQFSIGNFLISVGIRLPF